MWMALLPLTQALELVHRGSTFRVLGGSRQRASRWTPEYVKLLLSPRHSRGITRFYSGGRASRRVRASLRGRPRGRLMMGYDGRAEPSRERPHPRRAGTAATTNSPGPRSLRDILPPVGGSRSALL